MNEENALEQLCQNAVKSEVGKYALKKVLEIHFGMNIFTRNCQRKNNSESIDYLFLEQFAGLDGTYTFKFDMKSAESELKRMEFERLVENYDINYGISIKDSFIDGTIIGEVVGTVLPILTYYVEKAVSVIHHPHPSFGALIFQGLVGAGVFGGFAAGLVKQNLTYAKAAEEALRKDYLQEPFLLERSNKMADYQIIRKLIKR